MTLPAKDPFRRVEAGRAPRIWGLSDPHLGLAVDKPMDIFGLNWTDHHLKIREMWLQRVAAEDLVVIPGDLSWALKLEQARPDLEFIDALPGRKIIGKGNHCHWWPKTHAKFAALSYKTLTLAHGVMHTWDDLSLLFCRGWWMKQFYREFDAEDQKIWERELERLKLLLRVRPVDREAWVVAHFPFVMSPQSGLAKSVFHELIVAAGVTTCLYGHMHGDAIPLGATGVIDGVNYVCLSCDAIDFTPQLLWPRTSPSAPLSI